MRRLRRKIGPVASAAVILGGLWALGGFKSNVSSISHIKQLDLQVEKERRPRINDVGTPTGDFDEYVKFTNIGRSNIIIWNVLINTKEHCAKLGGFEPPVTLLDMGGWSSLQFVCSGEIAEVRVRTDRGNATYSWR